MAKTLPLLGLGNLKDIANACIYLLSDASRWVTGSYLVVEHKSIINLCFALSLIAAEHHLAACPYRTALASWNMCCCGQ